MSVKISMNARGSSGSVGRPGFGSKATRTAPRVARPQFAPHTVSMVLGSSLSPGICVVKTLGWKPVLSSR
jgi:hypothetical protein